MAGERLKEAGAPSRALMSRPGIRRGSSLVSSGRGMVIRGNDKSFLSGGERGLFGAQIEWRGGGRPGPSPGGASVYRLSMASGSCPVTANRTAQPWPLELPSDGQRICPAGQLRGFTPLPVVASVSRMESPEVSTRWAWCMSRSTVALAMVLGISSSKPLGCRFELMASDLRS